MALLDKLTAALARSGAGPQTGATYVVAVSGGRDSVVLFDLMRRAVGAERIAAAHFNHALRGADSDAEQKLVEELAARAGSRCLVGRGEGRSSSEASLRNERHAFLQACLREQGAQWIVTAHHLDDRIETVVMRLLRGTGLDGLQGIARRRGPYVRPLLDATRDEITRYAADNGLRYFDDASNAGRRYLRNRVRHDVMPALRVLAREFGGMELAWGRMARTLDEVAWASAELETQSARLFDELATRTAFWVRIPLERWEALDRPWRLRVLRRIQQELGAPVTDRLAGDAALDAIARGERAGQLEGQVGFRLSCSWLYFSRTASREPAPRLQLASRLATCEALGWAAEIEHPELDHLELRFARPGDRWGGGKLKEYFLEKRVPFPERRLVPLLARRDSPEVRWILTEPHPDVRTLKLSFPFSFPVR